MRILTVCGSLQAKSENLRLLQTAGALAPAGVDLVAFDGLRALPLFNPDLEAAEPPGAVRAWRQALMESDAVMFASPEYAHSLPGSVKNGIDWVVGSGELYRKIVAITAAVPHPSRGRLGLSALAQALRAVDAVLVFQEPTVRGPAFDAGVADVIRALAEAASESHV
jgi:chromate reductase